LLKRLRFAFQHGLTFTVGVSMSSGRDNCVTWASIYHKTALSGGVQNHGFPDRSYFDNCNNQLDALRVPAADDLLFTAL
jgi:Deltex C-terminal domain